MHYDNCRDNDVENSTTSMSDVSDISKAGVRIQLRVDDVLSSMQRF